MSKNADGPTTQLLNGPPPLPELMTVAEVAEILRTTPSTVRARIEDGTIPGVRIGKKFLVARAVIAQKLKEAGL